MSHRSMRTRTYRSWESMKYRATKKTCKVFHRYGARGIGMTQRWKRFENFLADMGECPVNLSLDRINNDKGYSKKNCRWADAKTQAQNRRSAVFYKYNGKMFRPDDLANLANMEKRTLWARLNLGWTVKEAVETPVRTRHA